MPPGNGAEAAWAPLSCLFLFIGYYRVVKRGTQNAERETQYAERTTRNAKHGTQKLLQTLLQSFAKVKQAENAANGFQPLALSFRPQPLALSLELSALSCNLGSMKRLLMHGAFWLVYLLQDTVLQLVWVAPALKNIPEYVQVRMAFEAAIAALMPKLLFTYFILYVAVPKIVQGTVKLAAIICQVAIAFLVTVVLYRLIFAYYINPIIYSGVLKTRSLFHVLNLLLAVMDIGFVSGVAITLKLLRIQLAAREREKNLVREKLEAELKFLRHQTNPHFLFNTLNNIYALARKRSAATAEVVMRLSKLLRFMLYESKRNLITIADELKILDDYIALEKMRYERLTIHFQRDIDDETRKIAPLLLLPFVENAFKHGASESRFDSFIRMQVQLQQGRLTFSVENTKENDFTGNITENIGLHNVRRQLELMYPDHDLQLQNEATTFSVRLSINLTSYAQV